MDRFRCLLVAEAPPHTVGVGVWRRLSRVAVAVVCVVLAGWVALPSAGRASATFGSDLTATPQAGALCS